MAAIGVFVLGIGIFLWWQFIFTDPQRVFEGMIKESLNSRSVTKITSQDTANQSVEQINRLQFGAQPAVVSRATISQSGPVNATVVTEEIGTVDRDYVRYVTIDTDEVGADGEPIDFSEIIGLWGISEVFSDEPEQGESFNEAVLGVIPFASLPTSQQRELQQLALDTGVYRIDLLGVTKQTVAGRPVYRYPVLLQPVAYIGYLKAVAAAMGLEQLETLDPATFASVPEVRFEVEVDVLSRRPTAFYYANATDRAEVVRSYDVVETVAIPEEVIPAQELQQRIQSIQQP